MRLNAHCEVEGEGEIEVEGAGEGEEITFMRISVAIIPKSISKIETNVSCIYNVWLKR
jgi:hypothetical protein